MRRLICSAFLLLPVASALTPAQRTTHINQVLSNVGAVVQDCPSSLAASVCASTTSSVSLTTKEWDLYSDWASKVAITAKHVTPWTVSSSNNNIMSAQFRTTDGDRYVVVVGTVSSKTMIAIKWVDTNQGNTTPTEAPKTSGVTGAPSAVVNASAVATRTGPLQVSMGNARSYELLGPVKRVVRRTMAVTASGENLKSTETMTFSQGGELLTYEQIEPGKSPYTAVNTFDGNNRLITREVKDDKGKMTKFVSEYDAQGNLTTRTKIEGDKKASVTRFTPMPNGYIAEEYGETGAATSRTFTRLDERNRRVDEEMLGSLKIRTQYVYEGDHPVQSTFEVGDLGITTIEYVNGLTVKSSLIGAGLLKGRDTISFYRYENVDKNGNFSKKLKGEEKISFGEKAFVVQEVTYQTVDYY